MILVVVASLVCLSALAVGGLSNSQFITEPKMKSGMKQQQQASVENINFILFCGACLMTVIMLHFVKKKLRKIKN